MSSPKSLLSKLKSKTKSSNSIDFQLFRGIKNSDGTSNENHYCYAISFLQLFFHCPAVINYFKTAKPKKVTERLLSKIFKDLYRKNNYSSIDIYNFILNWRGWEGNCLPNENKDIAEFIVYLLDSLSNKLSDLFLIQGEFFDDSIAPLNKNYFLTLLPIGNTLEEILNNNLNKVVNFTHLPEYLILYLVRNEDTRINENFIPINTFLNIDNIVYKHISTSVFGGEVSGGHYTSYIKIDDEYFLFNDELVSPLFYYDRCPNDLRKFISDCNNQMNRRGTIFLYSKFNGNYIPKLYENISFQSPSSTKPGSSYIIAMKNTLRKINMTNNKKRKSSTPSLSKSSLPKSRLPKSSLLNLSSSSSSSRSSSSSSSSGSSSSINQNKQTSSTPSTPLSHSYFQQQQANQNITSSQPRPFRTSSLSSNESLQQSFFIQKSPYGGRVQKNVAQFMHSTLKRDVINIQSLKLSNLCGKMVISMTGIPSMQDKRKDPSKFAKIRFLLKYAGKILRNLQYNDQGKINSEILSSHYEIDEVERKEIEAQGEVVYKALNDLKYGEFNEKDVEQNLSSVIEWYLINYGNKEVKDLNHDTIINDDLKQNLFDPIVPRDECLTEKELNEFVDNIIGEEEEEEFMEDEGFTDLLDFSLDFSETNTNNMNEKIKEYNDDFNDLFEYFYNDKLPKNSKHMLFVNPKLEDVIDYDPNDGLFSNEPFMNALNEENDYAATYDFKITKKKPKKSMLNKIAKKLEKADRYYTAGALEWLGKEKNYRQVYNDGINDNSFEDDDNQFSISFYNWKERAEIIDVNTLYETIVKATAIANKKKKSKEENDNIKKSILILEITQDLLRLFSTKQEYKYNRRSFFDDYNYRNSFSMTMPSCVKTYREIKNIPNDIPIYTNKTISKKIRWFEKMNEDAKEIFLNQDFSNWGGSRQILQKVNDETLLCLITLVLDFPTLSTTSYVTYLNSKYGPNYMNNISLRTVERYLNIIGFKVKRASFAPPNRNSVGLRIYRIAWCKIIEDILENENVLLGFIDEAAITTCEGKNSGRAFNGITPLSNCPLSKIKMTVIALVFPGFGVIYKVIEKSATGDQYAQFLKEAIEFTRKYICNKQTEIVIIEDNCPIHSTEKVEKTVEELNIALLPIVQYSAALNGVAEGFFEIVKTHIFIDSTSEGDNALKDTIEEEWNYSTLQYFNDTKSIQLFREWRTRMQNCKKGIPLFSEHVSISNNYDDEIENQLNVSVDRVMNEVTIQI